MEDKKIKQLLDSYFEGTTSLPEEQYLRDYFRQESIDPEFELYRPMFQFFSEEKESLPELNPEPTGNRKELHVKPGITKRIRIWVSVGAAACVGIFLFLSLFLDSENNFSDTSIAYINGKEHTDISTIRAEVLDLLDTMEEENEQILSTQIELLENLLN